MAVDDPIALAFESTRVQGVQGPITVAVETVATLPVTGPIACVDPSCVSHAASLPVKSGTYVVELAIANGRIVTARMRDGDIVRWERIGNVLVEYGIACFASAAALPVIGEAWQAIGQAVADKRGMTGWGWTRHAVGEHTAVAFTSGAGDGVYPAWRGLDANEQPAAVAIDFGLLRDPIEEEALIEAALDSPAGAICELDHGVLVIRTARGFEIRHPNCHIASARFVDAAGRDVGTRSVLPGVTTTLVEPVEQVSPGASLLLVLHLGTRPFTMLERRP